MQGIETNSSDHYHSASF